jgi:hypothetical protein
MGFYTPAQLLELLPPASARIVRHARSDADACEAAVRSVQEDLDKAQRRLAHARENDRTLQAQLQRDPRLAERAADAKQRVHEATLDIVELTKKRDALMASRDRAANAAYRFETAIQQMDGVWGVAPTLSPSPLRGDELLAEIKRQREEVARRQRELADISNTGPPAREVIEELAAQVAALGASYYVRRETDRDGFTRIRSSDMAVAAAGQVMACPSGAVLAYRAAKEPEVLLAELCVGLDLDAPGIPRSEKPARLKAARTALWGSEWIEENLVRQAEAQGLAVERRSGVAVHILLGLLPDDIEFTEVMPQAAE